MDKILLRGHHVKNLYLALKGTHDGGYDFIINNPNSIVKIVAGEPDFKCREPCSDLEKCFYQKSFYTLYSRVHDHLMAKPFGIEVGQNYISEELISKLQSQSFPTMKMVKAYLLYLTLAVTLDPFEYIFIPRKYSEIPPPSRF